MATPTRPKTLAPLCDAFVEHLVANGKSESTAKSYAGDLSLARKHFGDEMALSKITKKAVEDFFSCDAVNLTREGKSKNKITTDKIKRVFRLAMDWACEQGFIKQTPVPAPEKKEAAKAEDKAKDASSKGPVLKKPRKKAEPKAAGESK